MKKLLLTLIIALTGIFCASAATIYQRPNSHAYFEDFTIIPGDTLCVPLYLDLDTACWGISGRVYLPDGLSMVKVDGQYFVQTERSENMDIYTSSLASDGSYRLSATTMSATAIDPLTGVFALCYIHADESFNGPATISFTNWASSTVENVPKTIKLGDATCTVYDVSTAVTDVATTADVVDVTYFSVAGVEAAQPMPGVNICVTTHSDGTVTTSKILR